MEVKCNYSIIKNHNSPLSQFLNDIQLQSVKSSSCALFQPFFPITKHFTSKSPQKYTFFFMFNLLIKKYFGHMGYKRGKEAHGVMEVYGVMEGKRDRHYRTKKGESLDSPLVSC